MVSRRPVPLLHLLMDPFKYVQMYSYIFVNVLLYNFLVPVVNLDCGGTPENVWQQLLAIGRLMRPAATLGSTENGIPAIFDDNDDDDNGNGELRA